MASVHAVTMEGSRRNDQRVVPSSARIRGTATPTDESVQQTRCSRQETNIGIENQQISGWAAAAPAFMAAAYPAFRPMLMTLGLTACACEMSILSSAESLSTA